MYFWGPSASVAGVEVMWWKFNPLRGPRILYLKKVYIFFLTLQRYSIHYIGEIETIFVQISRWMFLTIDYSSAFWRNIKPALLGFCCCCLFLVMSPLNSWTYLSSCETSLVHLFCICSRNISLTLKLNYRMEGVCCKRRAEKWNDSREGSMWLGKMVSREICF